MLLSKRQKTPHLHPSLVSSSAIANPHTAWNSRTCSSDCFCIAITHCTAIAIVVGAAKLSPDTIQTSLKSNENPQRGNLASRKRCDFLTKRGNVAIAMPQRKESYDVYFAICLRILRFSDLKNAAIMRLPFLRRYEKKLRRGKGSRLERALERDPPPFPFPKGCGGGGCASKGGRGLNSKGARGLWPVGGKKRRNTKSRVPPMSWDPSHFPRNILSKMGWSFILGPLEASLERLEQVQGPWEC